MPLVLTPCDRLPFRWDICRSQTFKVQVMSVISGYHSRNRGVFASDVRILRTPLAPARHRRLAKRGSAATVRASRRALGALLMPDCCRNSPYKNKKTIAGIATERIYRVLSVRPGVADLDVCCVVRKGRCICPDTYIINRLRLGSGSGSRSHDLRIMNPTL